MTKIVRILLLSSLAIALSLLANPPKVKAAMTATLSIPNGGITSSGITFNFTSNHPILTDPTLFIYSGSDCHGQAIQSFHMNVVGPGRTSATYTDTNVPSQDFSAQAFLPSPGILSNCVSSQGLSFSPIPAPPGPGGACDYNFDPKTVGGSGTFTVSINNTNSADNYSVYIGGNLITTVDGNNSTVNVQATAPPLKGVYPVTVTQHLHDSGNDRNCTFPAGVSNELTVTTDKLAGSAGPPAPNPCASGTCNTALGNIPTDITGLATKVLSIAIGIAGGIALILLVFGSIRVLTSSGDQQRLSGGRDTIIAAIAGLLFLIFSVLILKAIGIAVGIPLT